MVRWLMCRCVDGVQFLSLHSDWLFDVIACERGVYVYIIRILPYQIPKENQMPSKTKKGEHKVRICQLTSKFAYNVCSPECVALPSHIAFRLMHSDVKSNAIKRCEPKMIFECGAKKENLITWYWNKHFECVCGHVCVCVSCVTL